MNKFDDDSYRVAWESLKDEIVDMINYSYDLKIDLETLKSVLALMHVLHI